MKLSTLEMNKSLFCLALLGCFIIPLQCKADCEVNNLEYGHWVTMAFVPNPQRDECFIRGTPTDESIMPSQGNGGWVYVIQGRYKALFVINATHFSSTKPGEIEQCADGYSEAYGLISTCATGAGMSIQGTLCRHEDIYGRIAYSRLFDYAAKAWEWICYDQCPDDPDKTKPGLCGCGTPDIYSNGNGFPDCINRKNDGPPDCR
jgi:hypothetical protein